MENDVNVNEILETSFGSFHKNMELLEQVYKLVMADNDKYPKRSLSNEFFPVYKIIRNRSSVSGDNVLKLFDDSVEKKNPPQVAQYSFGKRICMMFNHYKHNEKAFSFYCLHHNDMDGDASASVVRNKFSTVDMHSDPFNYNDTDFKNWITKVREDKRVNDKSKKVDRKEFILFAVDLSFKFSELKSILEVFDHVYWIDHHATSLVTLNNISGETELYKKLTYFIDTRFCATYLANYFLKKCYTGIFNTNMVTAALINLYDLKLDKQFPEAYKYAVYLNTYYWSYNNINMYSNVWFNLLCTCIEEAELSRLNKILNIGKELFDIDQKKNRLLFDNDYKYVFDSEFKNNDISKLRIVGLFQFGSSNKIIGYDDAIPTIKMLVRYNEKDSTFSFSLYTDSEILGKLNLGQIMLKYGLGGGHPKACGGSITLKDYFELTDQIDEFYDKDHYKSTHFHYENNKLSNIFDIYREEDIEEFREVSGEILGFAESIKINHERYEMDIEFLVKIIFCIIAREIITRKYN
nr:MAG TPA_asm: putative phosphohydrolase [Caudoviricetes sp.]